MTDHPLPSPARTGQPVQGLVWLFASLAVAILGWLRFALSEAGAERVTGVILLVLGLLGIGTAGLVLRGNVPNRLPATVSALFVLGGLAGAVVAATRDRVFISDVLLLGGLPVLAGVVTYLVSRGRRV